jgi:phage protein D
LQVSIDGGVTYVSLIQGATDTVGMDVATGVVQIEGRDYAASLLSTNTQGSFENRTASEIVTIIAQRHGLTPIIAAGGGLVGSYDGSGRQCSILNQFSRSVTDWDLLAQLASAETCDLYVDGRALYFQPTGTTVRSTYTIYSDRAIRLRLERSLPFGNGAHVVVKSWNVWSERQVTSIAGATQSGALSSGFVLSRPNLESEDVTALAQQQLAEVASYEWTVELDIPGELAMTTRDLLLLQGTGTIFDQTYAIESIDRHLSSHSGFTQRIRARRPVAYPSGMPAAT